MASKIFLEGPSPLAHACTCNLAMQLLVFNIFQIGNSHTRSALSLLVSPHYNATYFQGAFVVVFLLLLSLFLAVLNSSQLQRKKTKQEMGSSMGAASRGKGLDHRLRIAGSGAKGEKGRGNG